MAEETQELETPTVKAIAGKKKAKKTAGTGKKRARAGKGKTLVIVESPAKAKTIHKYLGASYIIEASMGHLIDLPRSRMAVNVEKDFEPEYITVRGRAKILNRLKKIASNTDRVLLAADPDREGEAISFHLARALGPGNSQIKRIEFNEITKAAVQEAVKNPRDINMDLVNAQQARRILDRLVGYNISPLLWKKIKRGLSAGRVQSVALKLVCDREAEIDKFIPEEYWTLDAKFLAGKKSFEASLASVDGKKSELKSKEDVDSVLARMEGGSFNVQSVTTKERRRQPPAPYTTSRLQQDGTNRLGFTSQKTMMVAQQLYEGMQLGGTTTGLITYMRTDSTRVSPGAVEQLRTYIQTTHGDSYLSPEVRQFKSSKSAQDAHEAIRPTEPSRHPDDIQKYLSKEQYRLYRMIWENFVASQMSDEVADQTTAELASDGVVFRANGRRIKFTGFTEIQSAEEKKKKEKETELPPLEVGEAVTLDQTIPEQHFTQPPPRFTDASMVKILEESGVGRPSTYAPTIQTLLKRYYVVRKQRSLQPTELGKLVNSVMIVHFKALVDTGFTARMEDDLDRVAANSLTWTDMLHTFYDPFVGVLKDAAEKIGEMRNVLDEKTEYVCEKCGKQMVKRIGRNGYFLACPGFPECKNAKPIPLGKCPKCEPGLVVQKATRRGRPFFSCNQYPECDFSTWDKPTGELCPTCGKMLLEKSSREKGKYVACSSCDFEEVEKSA
ncbi:MAG: type I DNA topoisomerase [Spirochaetia bacterium]|nr:type I DNA topoisomerase [Spirochaetia bacterium]